MKTAKEWTEELQRITARTGCMWMNLRVKYEKEHFTLVCQQAMDEARADERRKIISEADSVIRAYRDDFMGCYDAIRALGRKEIKE